MYVARIAVQRAARSAAQNQTTTERPERPERPEQPERPEAGSHQAPPSAQELRDQIKQTILAAQDAARQAQIEARNQSRDAQNQARDAQNQARDAQNQARDAANQVRIEAGLPVVAQGGSHTIQLDNFPNNVIPPQVVDISIAFFVMCAVMVIGWPLARAFGRRLERNASSAAAVPAAMGEQLQRIEQAVEAMSIEIERISESQRFLTKLQSANTPEHAALPASERR
ncbi:MAG TPA: hypothetical protein VGP25_00245 [Gemmatimonadaceae bacterium]|nr:hypothetical protein [Gemmatimonadaceae bacterium]